MLYFVYAGNGYLEEIQRAAALFAASAWRLFTGASSRHGDRYYKRTPIIIPGAAAGQYRGGGSVVFGQ